MTPGQASPMAAVCSAQTAASKGVFYRDKNTSAQFAEHVTHRKKHPQCEGKSRQAARGVRIPDTYKLPALQIIRSPSHTVQDLFGKKRKKISVIMSGQMGILTQFKTSGPNLGAGWSGGDDERGGRYPPCMYAACTALQGGFYFIK